MKKLLFVVVLFFCIFNPVNNTFALPAFPEAEGFGANTRGAYSGSTVPQIIKVTNLENSGPGSLRAAFEASGPRIVIFETGGRIWLSNKII